MNDATGPDAARRMRHPFLVYNLARLALLGAAAGLSYLVGLRGLVLVVAAFVVSGVVSIFVLSRWRDAMSLRVSAYFSRINAKIDESARAEDDLVDEIDVSHRARQPAQADSPTPTASSNP